MVQVNIHQAKSQLSRLVELASEGEEIVIARAGRPVARLVPYQGQGEPRQPGRLKGKIRIHKEFDEPLPEDLLGLFEGKVG